MRQFIRSCSKKALSQCLRIVLRSLLPPTSSTWQTTLFTLTLLRYHSLPFCSSSVSLSEPVPVATLAPLCYLRRCPPAHCYRPTRPPVSSRRPSGADVPRGGRKGDGRAVFTPPAAQTDVTSRKRDRADFRSMWTPRGITWVGQQLEYGLVFSPKAEVNHEDQECPYVNRDDVTERCGACDLLRYSDRTW